MADFCCLYSQPCCQIWLVCCFEPATSNNSNNDSRQDVPSSIRPLSTESSPTQLLPMSPLKKTRPSIKLKRLAKRNGKQHSHDKWVALVQRCWKPYEGNGIYSRFADFLCKVLPQSAPQKTPQHHPKIEHRTKIEMLDIEGMPTTQQPPRSAIATQTELPSTASTGEMSVVTRHRNVELVVAVLTKLPTTMTMMCKGSME